MTAAPATLPGLLVVEDEEAIRFMLKTYFRRRGFEVHDAEDVGTALAIARSRPIDVAILDWTLPDGDGLQLLHELRAIDADLPVVLLTGHGSIDRAVRAVRDGAEHFLTKPVDLESLRTIVERASTARRAKQAALAAAGRAMREAVDPFFGESPAVRRLASEARRVAAAAVPALLLGETGSGKGALARWIHEVSPRRAEAFVDLNCAGLTRELVESELFGHERGAFTGATASKPGLFEVANRGTIFLDEIGDLPLELQPKLLKVVEEKTYRRLGDVQVRRTGARLLAATHQDLEQRARDGGFRLDLFFRLSAVTLRVPPLRERGRDVLRLADVLLLRLATELGRPVPALARRAEEALLAHDWPGNIRELKNVLERALLLSDARTFEAADLGFHRGPSAQGNGSLTLRDAEKHHIESVLAASGFRVEEAAATLGVSRSTLYDKLRRHGIRLRRN